MNNLFSVCTTEVLSSIPAEITQLFLIQHHSMANLPIPLLSDSTGRLLRDRFHLVHNASLIFLLHLYLRHPTSTSPDIQRASTESSPSSSSSSSSSKLPSSAVVLYSECHAPDINVVKLVYEEPERSHVSGVMCSAGLSVQQIGSSSQFQNLVKSSPPRLISAHCHGCVDGVHPDENKLNILSKHSEWLNSQENEFHKVLPGRPALYKAVSFVDVFRNILINQDSSRILLQLSTVSDWCLSLAETVEEIVGCAEH